MIPQGCLTDYCQLLGGTTCLALLASGIFYGIPCLIRLIEFAAFFDTFEEGARETSSVVPPEVLEHYVPECTIIILGSIIIAIMIIICIISIMIISSSVSMSISMY